MSQLLDLESKLSVLALNPCACTVCREAAKSAKQELAEASPLDLSLLGTPKFEAAVQKFHTEETARLLAAYNRIVGQGKCLLDRWVPPATLTPIPELPAAEDWHERIEHYRKHSMKPRLRRDSAEAIENPRIPGSYTFK